MNSGKLVGGPKNDQDHVSPSEYGVIFTDIETGQKHVYQWDENLGRFGYMAYVDRRGPSEDIIDPFHDWEMADL